MTRSPAGAAEQPSGEGLVEIGGAGYYAVPDVDQIPPFLMSVVSDGDRWMFISSTGGLTAGRVDASDALFRYETDDRLHDAAGVVGPVTAIRVVGEGGSRLWSPFGRKSHPDVRRFLYKSVVGDSIIFEEIHHGLQLRFRYRWASSDRFGFVRTATLVNEATRSIRVELMDGLLNVLPHGLDPKFYAGMSNLTNAYKRSELIDTDGRLAVFSLESQVVDRPEPAESLRCSTVWSIGLNHASVTVTPDALAGFEADHPNEPVRLLTGRPGSYLLHTTIELDRREEKSWHIVADVARDQIDVAELRHLLDEEDELEAGIEASLRGTAKALVDIMAPADAQQRTGDRVATAHHFSNVTYNVMRGGIPLSGYRIAAGDFAKFARDRNRLVADRHQAWIESLPDTIERNVLLDRIRRTGDAHLMRLGLEYLPFSFSRRHGDPSRPWNAFSIRVRDEVGRPIMYYEGNWRDIFQNWEALCAVFPGYLPGVISVFVNASTPDGFNPYRITRDGFDWEVPNPDDPWSNIGYWGDHQIVYLLRLLDAADRFLPGEVNRMLGERLFTYADVPYRIAPYEDLVRDPKSTIGYDDSAAASSSSHVDRVGSDGKLLRGRDGEPYLVTLVEKLLVAALAKLSNYVPGGGIWMNTQRPEWNDANNALVGFGLSMVTLSHLRSYLEHMRSLFRRANIEEVAISREVAAWFSAVSAAFDEAPAETTDRSRQALMDELGRAFSRYRLRIYESGFSGATPVALEALVGLCDRAIGHLDHTIRGSRRPDGLYHSYNLIRFAPDGSGVSVEHMHEMLEGQVAVLESGVLTFEERADLIDALYSSAMYRADQRSFMLYPAGALPSFLDKNVVPAESVTANPLLEALLEAGDGSVVAVDADGRFRFNAGFANRADLEERLDRLTDDPHWSSLVAAQRENTLDAYEKVFRHHAYTGRSGSMYGYEGIGSIYWHMVAKLLVAVQASAFEAATGGAPAATVERLTDAYRRVRSGLGFNKTAREFGAVPIDPYSHTPAHAGAQQPGMTGLVKEELLTRNAEVGVRVVNGEIRFDPLLLRTNELLGHPEQWSVYDLALEPSVVDLHEGSLGVTICGVPVVVSVTRADPHVEVVFADGRTERQSDLGVNGENSAKVFNRSGEITRIHAFLPGGQAQPGTHGDPASPAGSRGR